MTPADRDPSGEPRNPPGGRGDSSGGHRGGRGDRRSRPSYPPGGRDRGAAGPTRRPSTTRPPAVDPARQVALDVLRAVREDAAYANLVLPVLLRERGISGRDAGLATELTYGTCRALGQLDAIAAAGGNRPHADLDGVVVDALRLGTYQLLHTRIPPHAAVSATVDLVRAGPRPGAAGYVNAVLRRVAENDIDGWIARLAPPGTDPQAVLALRWAHPRWIVTAFADALNPGSAGAPTPGSTGRPDTELEAALAADDAPPLTHLLARPGLIDRDELADMAGGVPARFSPYGVYSGGGNPGGMAAIADGRAAVQDEGSQLVALALAAAPVSGPDTRWLDLAAGPGGKAALLAAIAAERDATLDAVEITPHRAQLVRRTTRGLPVTVHVADGRDPGLPVASFDRVLLDAPCTGLGALRRRPEARWRRQPSDVGDLVRLQRELLVSAARLVRPGGLVAYVTCSPHLSETVGVIGRAPAELELLDARPFLPGVPDLGEGPTVQLWPHRHGTDAMFLALLRRS